MTDHAASANCNCSHIAMLRTGGRSPLPTSACRTALLTHGEQPMLGHRARSRRTSSQVNQARLERHGCTVVIDPEGRRPCRLLATAPSGSVAPAPGCAPSRTQTDQGVDRRMDWGREGTSAPVHEGADPCVAAELPDMSKPSVLVVVLRRSGPDLTEGSLIPTGLFYGCLVLAGMGTALAVALGWSYAAVTRRVLRRRPVPPILLLGVVGITLRPLVALASGSAFLYLVQPILGTVAMA